MHPSHPIFAGPITRSETDRHRHDPQRGGEHRGVPRDALLRRRDPGGGFLLDGPDGRDRARGPEGPDPPARIRRQRPAVQLGDGPGRARLGADRGRGRARHAGPRPRDRGPAGKGAAAEHYLLRRDNVFADRVIRHSGWGQDRLVRLLRRGSARYPEQRVHADMHPDGPTPTLAAPLLHYTFRSMPQYLEKLHRYAEWGARDLAQQGRRAGFVEVVLSPRVAVLPDVRPPGRIPRRPPRLRHLLPQAYGTFLKWARLWEPSGWRREI